MIHPALRWVKRPYVKDHNNYIETKYQCVFRKPEMLHHTRTANQGFPCNFWKASPRSHGPGEARLLDVVLIALDAICTEVTGNSGPKYSH